MTQVWANCTRLPCRGARGVWSSVTPMYDCARCIARAICGGVCGDPGCGPKRSRSAMAGHVARLAGDSARVKGSAPDFALPPDLTRLDHGSPPSILGGPPLKPQQKNPPEDHTKEV